MPDFAFRLVGQAVLNFRKSLAQGLFNIGLVFFNDLPAVLFREKKFGQFPLPQKIFGHFAQAPGARKSQTSAQHGGDGLARVRYGPGHGIGRDAGQYRRCHEIHNVQKAQARHLDADRIEKIPAERPRGKVNARHEKNAVPPQPSPETLPQFVLDFRAQRFAFFLDDGQQPRVVPDVVRKGLLQLLHGFPGFLSFFQNGHDVPVHDPFRAQAHGKPGVFGKNPLHERAGLVRKGSGLFLQQQPDSGVRLGKHRVKGKPVGNVLIGAPAHAAARGGKHLFHHVPDEKPAAAAARENDL